MSEVSALYEPLIERDLAAIPAAVGRYRAAHDSNELFLAVARFAVLAYAPSQHAKHAVLAALAAHDLRDEYGDRWDELLTECARYAAESRLPWSEPPILDPPETGPDQPRDTDALRAAVAAHDRLSGERWLAASLKAGDPEPDLFAVAADDFEDLGEKLVVAASAARLASLLGEKGRYAVLRMPVWEMVTTGAADVRESPAASSGRGEILERLIAAAVREKGSIESIQRILLFDAAIQTDSGRALAYLASTAPTTRARAMDDVSVNIGAPPVYHLARDYAHRLIVEAIAKRLRPQFLAAGFDALIAAAEWNRLNGDAFDDWSFA